MQIKGKPWGALEDEYITRLYPEHGARGMLDMGYLVDRTHHAIQRRACKLKVKHEKRAQVNENHDTPWPMPTMGLLESLECIRLRKWRYPVEPCRQLVPAIGAR